MASVRHPVGAKQRTDEIADLISAACEKLIDLSNEWFELNDKHALRHARQMLARNEVTLMLSTHLEASGLAHISLNLLRTAVPMPRPYFEVRVPMLPWKLEGEEANDDPVLPDIDPFIADTRTRRAR